MISLLCKQLLEGGQWREHAILISFITKKQKRKKTNGFWRKIITENFEELTEINTFSSRNNVLLLKSDSCTILKMSYEELLHKTVEDFLIEQRNNLLEDRQSVTALLKKILQEQQVHINLILTLLPSFEINYIDFTRYIFLLF